MWHVQPATVKAERLLRLKLMRMLTFTQITLYSFSHSKKSATWKLRRPLAPSVQLNVSDLDPQLGNRYTESVECGNCSVYWIINGQTSKFLLYCTTSNEESGELFAYLQSCVQAYLDTTFFGGTPLPTLPSLARVLVLAIYEECTTNTRYTANTRYSSTSTCTC